MPKANPIQASFARGEISPLLQGRVDLAPYAVAAKTILNGIVRLQGPITRRSGMDSGSTLLGGASRAAGMLK